MAFSVVKIYRSSTAQHTQQAEKRAVNFIFPGIYRRWAVLNFAQQLLNSAQLSD